MQINCYLCSILKKVSFMDLNIPPFLVAKGGLTSSKADFYANILKQLATSVSDKLEGYVLVQKKINSNGEPVDYVQLTPELGETEIVDLATKEGRYYAVSAWLRSGIKAKEDLVLAVRNADAKQLGVTLPVLGDYVKDLVAPQSIVIPKEDDLIPALAALGVAEYANYLSLEAQAAHIGKRIHGSTGLFNRWLQTAKGFKPVEFLTVNPTTAHMLTNTLRLSVESIDKILLQLQGLHREVESKVNAYKARLRTKVQESMQAAQSQRQAAERAWKGAQEQYYRDLEIASAEVETERSKALLEVSKLGIVVPNAHESILKEVTEAVAFKGDDE